MDLNNFLEKNLRENNGRLTKGKKAFFEVFSDEKVVLSMEELIDILSDKMNVSTIYRNVEKFIEYGFLKRINISGENFYTRSANSHKHFIICKSCHRKDELDFCPVDGFDNKFFGYDVTEHNFELIGICKQCKKGE